MGNGGSGGYVHHTVVYYNVEDELEEEEINIGSELDLIDYVNNILEQVNMS
jgi:hypothetical protein